MNKEEFKKYSGQAAIAYKVYFLSKFKVIPKKFILLPKQDQHAWALVAKTIILGMV